MERCEQGTGNGDDSYELFDDFDRVRKCGEVFRDVCYQGCGRAASEEDVGVGSCWDRCEESIAVGGREGCGIIVWYSVRIGDVHCELLY